MRDTVIVSCAVTGAGMPVRHRPVGPDAIADAAIQAAEAGAAIVHIHVRDPETGVPSLETGHYRTVVERVRASNVDVLINLTGGMGGEVYFDDDDLSEYAEGTVLIPALERIAHAEELLPDICSLDLGTAVFSDRDVNIYTPQMCRRMAERLLRLHIKPELEAFDLSGLSIVTTLLKRASWNGHRGSSSSSACPLGPLRPHRRCWPWSMLCPRGQSGVPVASPRAQMPVVAQAVLLGGNVRVGLEDNLYLEKGVPATNGQLVTRAIEIIERLGARAASVDEARDMLGIPPQ